MRLALHTHGKIRYTSSVMTVGLLLILFGVLIAVKPVVIIALFSAFFIAAGVIVCVVSWRWRRLRRRSGSPLVNWLIRW